MNPNPTTNTKNKIKLSKLLVMFEQGLPPEFFDVGADKIVREFAQYLSDLRLLDTRKVYFDVNFEESKAPTKGV